MKKADSRSSQNFMPDIAQKGKPSSSHAIQRVGMEHMEVMVKLPISKTETIQLGARANGYVSLVNKEAKGIHMSRLFLHLQDSLEREPLSSKGLEVIVKEFLASHSHESDAAYLKLSLELPLKRKALLSDNRGWRFYPLTFFAAWDKEGFHLSMEMDITYSSTCPCSAALARQLIQETFVQDFKDRGSKGLTLDEVHQWLGKDTSIVATPHGQRSIAQITWSYTDPYRAWDWESLIDLFEDQLKTPVQSAVKREDEQEFARLNGQNLMFVEDAVRKLAQALDSKSDIAGYRVKATHYESLHPHNAQAVLERATDSLTLF